MNANASIEILYTGFHNFYKHQSNWEKFLRYTGRDKCGDKLKKPVAFRTIDWLLTNYSRSHKTTYTFDAKAHGVPEQCTAHFVHQNEIIDLHCEYKTIHKSFHKKLCDPFGRKNGGKMWFHPHTTSEEEAMFRTDCLYLPICQLNFFKYAIPRGVVEFAIENKQLIENDEKMSKPQKRKRESESPLKASVSYKKRKRLSKRHKDQIFIDTNKYTIEW